MTDWPLRELAQVHLQHARRELADGDRWAALYWLRSAGFWLACDARRTIRTNPVEEKA